MVFKRALLSIIFESTASTPESQQSHRNKSTVPVPAPLAEHPSSALVTYDHHEPRQRNSTQSQRETRFIEHVHTERPDLNTMEGPQRPYQQLLQDSWSRERLASSTGGIANPRQAHHNASPAPAIQSSAFEEKARWA